MQLVMRRFRVEGSWWQTFKINARMVVDVEETGLLEKYKLQNVALTEGNRGRDLRKAALASGIVTLLAYFFLPLPPGIALLCFIGLCFVIYHQTREEIRVKDLLNGRDFNARSFIDLLLKEQMIRKASAVFAHVVNQSRTWEEAEVIDLEPQPLLTVLEGDHRAAA